MKIITRCVIDMRSLQIIEEESFEYDGPVAQCYTSTDSTTETYDPNYNAIMASVAVSNAKLSKQYFQFWQQGTGHNVAIPVSQWTARDRYIYQLTGKKPTKFVRDEGTVSGMELAAAQTKANMELIPYQTGLEKALLAENTQLSGLRTGAQKEYFSKAMEGVNPNEWMNEAEAAVEHGFEEGRRSLSDELFRGNIEKGSGAWTSAISDLDYERSKAIGGARTMAKRAADEESYERLKEASAIQSTYPMTAGG